MKVDQLHCQFETPISISKIGYNIIYNIISVRIQHNIVREILLRARPARAKIVHGSWACLWHELGMNKEFNPIFHAHESFSHAHEVMPLLHRHMTLLRDQKHEQSLSMGMN